MIEPVKLESKIDDSVNFVEKNLTGFIEARYVRRALDYFVCYLSSQSGCNKGCRFCHLTATKQTTFVDVDQEGFMAQAREVFKHYEQDNPAKKVHFNFMARGEVLANKIFLGSANETLFALGSLAGEYRLIPKFNLSTIIPKTFDGDLSDYFSIITPTIYYSLYSINPDFRKKWLPAAMPVEDALRLLREYQKASKKLVKIHYALIKGENDSQEDILGMMDMIEKYKLLCEFNLVRYNPFSPEQGVETDEYTLKSIYHWIAHRWDGRAKIIDRVGTDVFASCGMFVNKEPQGAMLCWMEQTDYSINIPP